MTRQPRHLNTSGLTLIEMLIALTIFGAIVSAAVWGLRGQSRGFTLGGQRMDLLQNVRYAVDALERNLRTAGANVPEDQPFLVYAGSDIVAFNGDYATNVANDPWAVYHDPDAPTGSVTALTFPQRITIPHSGFSYPGVSYTGTGGTGNSPAETIIFFVDADSSTARTDDYALYRQVNRDAPQLVARNLLQTGSTSFFEYFRITAASQIAQVAGGTLPLSHSVSLHGSVADTGAAALIDSVRGVRVNFTATNGLTGAAERLRSVSKLIRMPNAGMSVKLACGDEPILGAGLAAVTDTVPGGFPVVRLTWGQAVDETAGEQDVVRYVIWRRPSTTATWDDPYLSVPAGDTTYIYQDLNVQSGDRFFYGLAAQDCTPSLSTMVVSSLVVVP